MRHPILLAGAAAAALVASLPGLYPQRVRDDRPPLRRFTTPEPIKSPATLLPSKSSPLVAIRFAFRTGSQDDPPGKEGLAALTAAMVAEGGTRDMTYEQILERFYPLASGLSQACFKELTVFSGEVHRDNLNRYLTVVATMMTVPRFAPDDFERLKNEAIDTLSKTLRAGNDEELGKWALQVELYKGHPYGHVDAGTVAGLKAVTLEDVKAFYNDYYTRERLVLGVAGAADEALLDALRRRLSSLPSKAFVPVPLPKPQTPRGLDVTIIEKPTDSTAISLGFPIDVTRRDDGFYALAVANSYLGEHRTFNGKLMQDLREKRGLNYGDYAYLEDFIQDGRSTFPVPNNPRRQQYFSIWLRPVPSDKAAFALRAALWELDRLVKDGMSEADFESTRTFLLNYSKLWVQTLSRRLGYMMDGRFYDRDDLVTEAARQLPKLAVADVNAAVRRHLGSPGIKVVVVAKDAEGLKKTLMNGVPTPLVYDTEGTPENVLKEDQAIAAFPLKDVRVSIIPVAKMFEK
jgi:zinc protease